MILELKTLARLLILSFLSQMFCFCNKMDLTKEHTALGRNLLFFSIDGDNYTTNIIETSYTTFHSPAISNNL